ncbi:MAG: DUF192 domain-containing protein [Bacilli bacterium]|nr:DUF192 domain-containing protein [Bacilli bacterium]
MYLTIGKNKYKIIKATSFFKRLKGLMGKDNIDCGMLFPKCNSIHTFFMKENIDIIGLDENNEVIYKYQNLQNNQIIHINNPKKKTSILELPNNASKKIKLNSILLFEDE